VCVCFPRQEGSIGTWTPVFRDSCDPQNADVTLGIWCWHMLWKIIHENQSIGVARQKVIIINFKLVVFCFWYFWDVFLSWDLPNYELSMHLLSLGLKGPKGPTLQHTCQDLQHALKLLLKAKSQPAKNGDPSFHPPKHERMWSLAKMSQVWILKTYSAS